MQLCPARVGYAETDGFLPALSEALVFGTCVHGMAEYHLLNGKKADTKPNAFDEWMEGILNEEYQYSIEQIPDKEWKTFRRKAIEAYRLWVFQVYDHWLKPELSDEMFYVEADLITPIHELEDGRIIYLKGTPDLTLIGNRIVDFKTTNSRGWNQAKADYSIQASLYLWLHNQLFDEPLDTFDFHVYMRSKTDWNRYETKRTDPIMESAVHTAIQYGKQIATGVYPATMVDSDYGKLKRGWWCSAKYCGAWNICEHKFLNDDVNELEIASTKW